MIHIYNNPKKLALYFLGSLLFPIVSLFTAYIKFHEQAVLTHNDVLIIYISIFGTLFFLICSMIVLKKLFNEKPEISVDNDGILLQDYGFFKWGEIKDISIVEMGKNRFLGISINDQKKLEKKLNLFRKILVKLNSYYISSGIHIYIPLSALIISQDNIEAINKIKAEIISKN